MPLNFSKWEKLRLQWCITKNWLYMHKLHNNAYQMKTRFLLTHGHRGGPAAQEMPYDGSSLSKGANSNRPAHYNAFCWDILPAKCTWSMLYKPGQLASHMNLGRQIMNETSRNSWYTTQQTRKARKVPDEQDLDDMTLKKTVCPRNSITDL